MGSSKSRRNFIKNPPQLEQVSLCSKKCSENRLCVPSDQLNLAAIGSGGKGISDTQTLQ